jgi:hypothetical protein
MHFLPTYEDPAGDDIGRGILGFVISITTPVPYSVNDTCGKKRDPVQMFWIPFFAASALFR